MNAPEHDPQRPILPSWRICALAVLAYVAMAAAQTFPMVLHLADRTPARLNSIPGAYVLAEQARLFLVDHPFDFAAAFDPKVMAPMEDVFLMTNTALPGALVFGAFYLPTGSIPLAINAMILLGLVATAFCVMLLARHWLGNDRAAFLSGTVACFVSANLFLVVDFYFLYSPFIPLVLLFFDRFAADGRKRDLAVTSLLLVVQFFHGTYHLAQALFLLVILAVYRWRTLFVRRNLPAIALCGLVAILAVAPLAFATVAKIGRYIVPDRQIDGPAAVLSVAPEEWVRTSAGNPLYGRLADPYTPVSYEFPSPLFPGIAVIALIALALWGGRVKGGPSPWLLFGVMVFAMIAATGWVPFAFHKQEHAVPVVLTALSKVFPIFSFYRVPFRLVTMATLAAGLLAGFGFLAVLRRLGEGRLAWHGPVLALATAVILVENTSVPLNLQDYGYLLGKGPGASWIAEHRGELDAGESVLYVPSWLFTRIERQQRKARGAGYEEGYAPLFQHLYHRAPVANGRLSFIPEGWRSPALVALPSPRSQRAMRAIGVRWIVVDERLLPEGTRARLGKAAMRSAGLKPLAEFDEGVGVFAITDRAETVETLAIQPFATATSGGVRFRIPAPEGRDEIREAHRLWVNPRRCEKQTLRLTVLDGNGVRHRREMTYVLPLVIDEVAPSSRVEWKLAEEGLPGPFRVLAVAVPEPYLLQDERSARDWELERY
jgi:hypothetical protein